MTVENKEKSQKIQIQKIFLAEKEKGDIEILQTIT